MADAVLKSPLLASLPWLEHGFGTRHAPEWPPEAAAELEQIHSATVHTAAAGRTGRIASGDALVTAVPGLWLAIRTADCLPVLLADPGSRSVAAVHAGWRGTADGIVRAALELLVCQFGARREQIVAVIGPGIGPCCYEVGAEVRARFREWADEREDGRLDLAEVNRRQLAASGMDPSRIETLAACTRCDAANFFSYRREPGETRRMRSAIRIAAER